MARYLNKTQPSNNKKKGSVALLVIGIVALLLIGGIIGYLAYDTHLDHDNILDNVHVAGVNVSGMTKDEALAAVKNATADSYTNQPMTIQIADDTHTIDPALSGAQLDVDGAVSAAHAYGRQGFVFRRHYEQSAASSGAVQIDIMEYLQLNTDAIRAETDRLATQYNCSVVQSTFRVEGDLPDPDKNIAGDRTLYVTLGKPGYQLDGQALYAQVLQAYSQNKLRITAQCAVTKPDPLDLDAIAGQYGIAPVDAVMDEKTFVITDHKPGFGFDRDQVQQTLLNGEGGQDYTFPFQTLEASVTRASIEDKLFATVLSEYTAKYSSLYSRDTNLALSCKSVNGTILLPGEVFSYNSALGERTPEAGYKLGNTYSGLETVQSYGGGICQTSSTLYYCVMMADLEILERTNHTFLNTYVPYGMDATVSWGTLDFKFRNNSDYPIKLEAFSENGNVTVRILGTDYKDYYVKMEYEVLGVSGWKTVEQEFPPDNPKGYKNGEVITSPYTGYTVQSYRCKYDKATNELISKEKEAYSVYSKRDKVVCKIVEPAAPTDPSVPSTDVPVSPDDAAVTP